MPTETRPVPTTLLNLTGLCRLTVEQYRKMIHAGVFIECEPLELLEGYLVNSPRPISPRVSGARMRLLYRLLAIPLPGWLALIVPAVTLSDSEPEPDIVLARGDENSFRDRFPGPDEVGLVVEVADVSLAFDRRDNGRISARAGIAAYWAIHVVDKQVEVYSDPDPIANPPAYLARTDYKVGDGIPITLDGRAAGTIAASELIP